MRASRLALPLAFALAACASTRSAAPPATAPIDADEAAYLAPAEFPVLTWPEVERAQAGGAVLVDSRRASGYEKGTIPGAINVPPSDEAAFARLPAEKSTKLVFFCGGPACKSSLKAARKARDLGYADIAEYRGGYPEWSRTVAGP